MDDRQSRKLRQLQAEMIALANDREKATSADECRAIDAKLRALAEKGAAISASIKLLRRTARRSTISRRSPMARLGSRSSGARSPTSVAGAGVPYVEARPAAASAHRTRHTHTGGDEARPDESRGEALRRVQKADGPDGRLGRPGASVLFGRVRVFPRPNQGVSPRWRRGGRIVLTPSESERHGCVVLMRVDGVLVLY